MAEELTNCNNCNAAIIEWPTLRPVEGSTIIVEKIRHCDKCKREESLGFTSKEIMKLEKEIRMMKKKVEYKLKEEKNVTSLRRAIAHKKSAVARLSRELGI
jgi:transcriptional regulator NrdR family protein